MIVSSPHGVIVSVGDSSAEVRLVGDSTDTTIELSLSHYTATAGDKVALLKVGATLVILGKIEEISGSTPTI